MLTSQRKQHILEVLRRDGQIVAKTLSAELGLSEDTIRRDLRELAQDGLVQRVHGGALPVSPAIASFTERQGIASDAKVDVARAAAHMVSAGQIVLLDGGTTAVQLARALPRDLNATVVTHSPSIAVELSTHPTLEVILIGGRLFKHSVVTGGAAAVSALDSIRADLFFMGVTGVHPEAGLSTGDLEEAHMKRALMRRAAETIVLASYEKMGAASAYLIAPVREASTIITNRSLPDESLRPYQELGLKVIAV